MIDTDDYQRVPGLYAAWDFATLIEAGRSYVIEDGGRTDDGQALCMVFERSAAEREVREHD